MRIKCIAEAEMALGPAGFLLLVELTTGVVSLPSFTPDFVQEMKTMQIDQRIAQLLAGELETSEPFAAERSATFEGDGENPELKGMSCIKPGNGNMAHEYNKSDEVYDLPTFQQKSCLLNPAFELLANEELLDAFLNGEDSISIPNSCSADQIKERLNIDIYKNCRMTKNADNNLSWKKWKFGARTNENGTLTFCNKMNKEMPQILPTYNKLNNSIKKILEEDLLRKYHLKSCLSDLHKGTMEIFGRNVILDLKSYHLTKKMKYISRCISEEYLSWMLESMRRRNVRVTDIRALENHYQLPAFGVTKPGRGEIPYTYIFNQNQITFPNRDLFCTYNKCLHKVSTLHIPSSLVSFIPCQDRKQRARNNCTK